ncbi:23433_t:CDS:2 [Gigaspora margarita]|uniref:23433_t:CDS:1 n=1 Tax=Gigaspora margarita TaxID=4874 RepID=A0ABN7W511_GIGMA|nr:23433_t:CDS:2 [Gigaspora margarita]
MANPEQEAVISYLFKQFDLPNIGVNVDLPIEVYSQLLHIPWPSILHSGSPPSNVNVL